MKSHPERLGFPAPTAFYSSLIKSFCVITLVNEEQPAETYQAEWNTSGFSSGVYFYSLIIDNKLIDTKKMVYIS